MTEKKDAQEVIRAVMDKKTVEEKQPDEIEQVVVFEIDGEEYGASITSVREILTMSEITPIPNAPEFILGIINVRGTITIILDLEKRFGMVRENTKAQSRHIVLADGDKNTFGIVVDNVTEVLRIPKKQIRPVPELVSTKIQSSFLQGIVVLDEDVAGVSNKKEEVQESSEGGEEKAPEGEPEEEERTSRLVILLNMEELLRSKDLMQVEGLIHDVKNNQ